MQFIDLQAQYLSIKDRIDKRVHAVLDHGKYIYGPEVFELEDKLSDYVGVKHAITCANGTDALSLSLMALGIAQDDAIFCPTFTFFATAEVISHIGATPVFVDCEKDTFNISPLNLEEKIKEILDEGKLKPKAIIAVDLFGLPANYPELSVIAKKYNLKIIEDAAQGFGGEINGIRSGSFGHISTTSFFPAKPLGCYGDGGAVFTNSDEYASLIRSFAVHEKGDDKYDNVRIGINSRLDTIQAAILIEKLKIFPDELIARNRIAKEYDLIYKDTFITPTIPDGYLSSWAQYTLITKNRDDVIDSFNDRKIPTMIYYPRPLHLLKAFDMLGHQKETFLIQSFCRSMS